MFNEHFLPNAAKGAVYGSGAFATAQLAMELKRLMDLRAQEDRKKDLMVDVPLSHQKAIKLGEEFLKTAEGMVDDFIGNYGAYGVGIPAGFMGTKLIYDQMKKKKMQKDVQEANAKYMATLSSLGKMSEETPLLDAVCEKVAEELNKQAGAGDMLKRVFTSPVTRTLVPTAAIAGVGIGGPAISDKLFSTDLQRRAELLNKDVMSRAADASGVNTATDHWKTLAALAALTTGGAFMMTDKAKAEKEDKNQLPQNIALKYV